MKRRTQILSYNLSLYNECIHACSNPNMCKRPYGIFNFFWLGFIYNNYPEIRLKPISSLLSILVQYVRVQYVVYMKSHVDVNGVPVIILEFIN